MLASPVAGHGVPISRIQRLCLLAIREGARSVEAWAHFAQSALRADGVASSAPELLKQVESCDAVITALGD